MKPFRFRSRIDEGSLAALADGSLPASDRERVQRAVASSPELRAGLEAQRHALAALEAASVEAPAGLRHRVALAAEPAAGRPGHTPQRRLLATLALTVAPLLAVLIAVAVGQKHASGPTVLQAAALSAEPPQHAVARTPPASKVVPGLSAAGIEYPAWQRTYGYRAEGVRRDRLGGRAATTVYYAGPAGTEVAYTIVSGTLLSVGTSARGTTVGGVSLRQFSAGGRPVVTWVHDGHTCVLTGTPSSAATLVALASWSPAPAQPY